MHYLCLVEAVMLAVPTAMKQPINIAVIAAPAFRPLKTKKPSQARRLFVLRKTELANPE